VRFVARTFAFHFVRLRSFLLLHISCENVPSGGQELSDDSNLHGRRIARLSDLPKNQPETLSREMRDAKKAPAGIRGELERTYSPDANKFRRSCASEAERKGKGQKGDSEGSILATLFDPPGQPIAAGPLARAHRRACTRTCALIRVIRWMFMAEREYSIQ